jgi:hypothetical protein
MSMIAKFVQVEPAELSLFQADPSLVEALFDDGLAMPPQFVALANKM